MAESIPTGVKIISVLFFVSAFLFAVFGIMLFLGAGSTSIDSVNVNIFLATGFFAILIGILDGAIGWGLWSARPWARAAAIALLVFGIVGGGFAVAGGELVVSALVMLLFYMAGASYLAFSRPVKRAFA